MKRVVVKIGSAVVTAGPTVTLSIDRNTVYRLAREIAELSERGLDVIVVSSGAVAMGLEELGLKERPTEMATVQALAAVGQSQLMGLWRDAFRHCGRPVGQLLLTHDDLGDRSRFLNVRGTIDALLSYGVIPIVNENDTVATDEITVGDNDALAAQVAKLMGGDLLVLLTTVDGLLDGAGKLVPRVALTDDPGSLVRDGGSAVGRGGMASKLAAAAAACRGGIEVVIANGHTTGALVAAVDGGPVGTRFESASDGLPSRKHWIAYTLKTRGTLVVDAGAAAAVAEQGASLLPVGITRIEGHFEAGDAVVVIGPAGQELARGLVKDDSTTLSGRIGKKGPVAIHRDDLVRRV